MLITIPPCSFMSQELLEALHGAWLWVSSGFRDTMWCSSPPHHTAPCLRSSRRLCTVHGCGFQTLGTQHGAHHHLTTRFHVPGPPRGPARCMAWVSSGFRDMTWCQSPPHHTTLCLRSSWRLCTEHGCGFQALGTLQSWTAEDAQTRSLRHLHHQNTEALLPNPLDLL